jgi:hypothetical protein
MCWNVATISFSSRTPKINHFSSQIIITAGKWGQPGLHDCVTTGLFLYMYLLAFFFADQNVLLTWTPGASFQLNFVETSTVSSLVSLFLLQKLLIEFF